MPMIARPPLMWSIVVERLDRQPGIAERVRADEQAEPDPLGRLGQRRERGVALEDRLVRVAEDRQDVVPGPEVVEAELSRPAGRRRGTPASR